MIRRHPYAETDVPTLAEMLTTIDEHDAMPGTVGTGLEALDQALSGGFRPGTVALFGGGPGVGKTIVTLQMARNMAKRGTRVMYLCYEHDERTLFARLLHLELGELAPGAFDIYEVSEAIWRVAHREVALSAELDDRLVLRAAYAKVGEYAPYLTVVQGSGLTSVTLIEELVDQVDPAVLFVDYLQKVPSDRIQAADGDRISATVEGLKELALDRQMAVVAVVAGTGVSLQSRRLRLHDLRGAETLAYEADVVVMLNDKASAVSRRHSAYDPVRAREFAKWVVFSVEKNRHGPTSIDTEFRKHFSTYRFEGDGRFVEERLIDGTTKGD